MESRVASGMMLTLLLIGMLALAFEIQPVKAQGIIYIRADGSVEGTTSIASDDNVTYTFTDNIYDEIVVERSDTIIDGNGYTLQGSGSGNGLYISKIKNVTINNIDIKGFIHGIATDAADTQIDIRITNNTFSSNQENGINLYSYNSGDYYVEAYIRDIVILNNTFSLNGRDGIYIHSNGHGQPGDNYIYGHGYGVIQNVIISDNIFSSNGGNGVHLYGQGYGTGSGLYIGNGYGYIYDVTISNNTYSSNGGDGIYLHSYGSAGYGYGYGYIYNVTVSSNMILSNNGNGICLYGRGEGHSSVYNITVSNNVVSSNGGNALYLHSFGNYHYGRGYGYIYDVNISFNTFSYSIGNGIYLRSYEAGFIYNVAVYSNTVLFNGETGISLYILVADYGHIRNVNILSNIVKSNNGRGIHIYTEGYNTGYGYINDIIVLSNTVSSNVKEGIYLHSQGVEGGYIYNVTFSFNTILANHVSGIYLVASEHYADSVCDLTISENLILENYQKGIWIDGGININLTCNSISHNGYGIYLSQSYNSTIFHNNLIGNTIQAYAQDSINIWDNGYPSGGNYWSDYTTRYPDAQELDDSGIWDTPYFIDENNQDNYPLMEPWSPKPSSPVEALEELIETIETSDLPKGTENSLTAKLEAAIHLLNKGNENGAIHKLMDFINQVEAQRGKKLTSEQTDQLTSEAQRIIDLIKGE